MLQQASLRCSYSRSANDLTPFAKNPQSHQALAVSSQICISRLLTQSQKPQVVQVVYSRPAVSIYIDPLYMTSGSIVSYRCSSPPRLFPFLASLAKKKWPEQKQKCLKSCFLSAMCGRSETAGTWSTVADLCQRFSSLVSSLPSSYFSLRMRHQIKYLAAISLPQLPGVPRLIQKTSFQTMKVSCIVVLFVSTYLSSESVHANYRVCCYTHRHLIPLFQNLTARLTTPPHLQFKRQLGGYRFPGPRLSDDYASASRALVKREPQYEDEYSRPSASPQSPYRSPSSASTYQPEASDYPSRPYAPSSAYPRDNKRNVSPLRPPALPIC